MEERKQKSFSTILMLAGVVCIIVSGGIFVSKTWQYLPENIKKICLLAVTAGLFFGSDFAEKKSGLKKTAAALYYLGICFTGFTMISLLGLFPIDLSMKLSFALLSMSIPVALHFLKQKNVWDSIVEILLLDGMVVCVSCYSLEQASRLSFLTAMVVTLLLAAFIRYCKNYLPEEKGMRIGGIVAYGIHVLFLLPCFVFFLDGEKNFLFTVLPAALLTASVSLLYDAYQKTALRVFQSLTIFFLNYTAVYFIVVNFLQDVLTRPFGTTTFLTLLCNLCAAALLKRKEMLLVNSGVAVFSNFLQLFVYYFLNSCHPAQEFCFPYASCAAIALLFWQYLKKTETEDHFITKYSIALLFMELNSAIAFANSTYCKHYSLAFWFGILFLQAAVLCRHTEILRSVFKTIAMLFTLGALLAEPIVSTLIYGSDDVTVLADFTVEYSCFLMELGVVLLSFIWYYNKKMVQVFRFIATCILLAVLICSNLAMQALPNILFLGIVTLIMLVTATALKQKNYAIASAVTLILIVLYLTRVVWMSITWWVYLFVAGVGLVGYAVKRERAE